jgi:ATP-dependent DNA helicase Rep
VGLKEHFSILDSDDVLGVLRDAGGCHRQRAGAALAVDHQPVEEPGPGRRRAEAAASNDDERVAARVMRLYEERLQAYQAVDFDDLIGLPLKLLQRDEVRTRWQQRSSAMCWSTRYQDTNAVQYELLKAAGRRQGPVHRRGRRRPEHLRLARRHHRQPQAPAAGLPALKVIALEQNYRSTGHILRAANARDRATTPSCSRRSCGATWATASRCAWSSATARSTRPSAPWRASRACAQGASPGAGGSLKFSDFAILYRANHQAKVFEQKLRAAQIPYKVSGGQSFFDRAEIKDLCAWLRLLVNRTTTRPSCAP